MNVRPSPSPNPSRRQFVRRAVGAAAGFTLAPNLLRAEAAAPVISYGIELIEGEIYPPSFVTFAARARFGTTALALGSVRNPTLCFRLVPLKNAPETTPRENTRPDQSQRKPPQPGDLAQHPQACVGVKPQPPSGQMMIQRPD